MAGGLAACPVAPLHAGERGRGGWKPRRPHGARGAAAGAEPGGRRQPGSSRLPPEPGLVDAARCLRAGRGRQGASRPVWPPRAQASSRMRQKILPCGYGRGADLA